MFLLVPSVLSFYKKIATKARRKNFVFLVISSRIKDTKNT